MVDIFELANEVAASLNPILHHDDIVAVLEDAIGQHGLTEENFGEALEAVVAELESRGFTVKLY
jgi:hypothetical protein